MTFLDAASGECGGGWRRGRRAGLLLLRCTVPPRRPALTAPARVPSAPSRRPAEKTLRSTVALTAARGRGKSAALGLAIAGALALGYSNIFVTAPSPENLRTLFEFVFKGLDELEYKVRRRVLCCAAMCCAAMCVEAVVWRGRHQPAAARAAALTPAPAAPTRTRTGAPRLRSGGVHRPRVWKGGGAGQRLPQPPPDGAGAPLASRADCWASGAGCGWRARCSSAARRAAPPADLPLLCAPARPPLAPAPRSTSSRSTTRRWARRSCL